MAFFKALFSTTHSYWNQCKLFCEAFPFKHFLSHVTQMHLYRANKNLTKQLILIEQDQFLCPCEAAISIQQPPLQAD